MGTKPKSATRSWLPACSASLLGAFGVHKFVLGYTTPGVVMLVVSLAGGVVTCGLASFVMGVIGLIEGIIYLTKTPDEFEATYLDAVRPWF